MIKRKDGIDVRPAPGDLRIVQAFVNTADLETGTDLLAGPQALADWLAAQGLAAAGTPFGPADVARAARMRDGLRTLIAGGAAPGSKAAAGLEEAMAGALLQPRFGPGRELLLVPAADGLDGAIARMMAIVAAAQLDGTWRLLKACASPTCRAAFYDYSTNHSGRWCRARCGGRLATAAHRARRRRAGLKPW